MDYIKSIGRLLNSGGAVLGAMYLGMLLGVGLTRPDRVPVALVICVAWAATVAMTWQIARWRGAIDARKEFYR